METQDSFVYVARGNGNGTFFSPAAITTPLTSASEATFGDLNEDGITDLIVAGTQVSGKIVVRLGQGGGSFAAATSYTMAGANTFAVTLGDLNGDGHLDVVSTGDTSYTAAVRFGQGDGTFGAVSSYSTGGATTTVGVALADLNGDGVLDIGVNGSTAGTPLAFIRIADTTIGASPLLPFSLKSRATALQAIGPLDQKLAQLTVQRGVVGAFQSRLETSVNVLLIARENFQIASSQITDVDTAEEAAKLVRGKILQQSASAILAQANSQPKLALDLLKGSGKE